MDRESEIWKELNGARPADCGKLVEELLKIKFKKQKGSKDK